MLCLQIHSHHYPDWSQDSFNLADVEATLQQRRYNVVSTSSTNVVQRCATLKIWRRILFHFQRQINVISMLTHNVETTLIRRQKVGWDRCDVFSVTSQFHDYITFHLLPYQIFNDVLITSVFGAHELFAKVSFDLIDCCFIIVRYVLLYSNYAIA